MIRRRAVLQAGLLLPLLGRAARGQGAPLVFLGDRALPPYEFVEAGVARGANVDLAHAIGRVLGRPVEVQLLDWDEAQRRLLAGEGHALTMLGRSEQRDRRYDFSQPTMPALFAFFVREDQERQFIARNRFAGVRIAITRGGLAAELLGASHPDAELVEVANLPEGIDRLRLGTVDALAGNAWSIRHLLVQRRNTGVSELPPFARRSGNIAVREGDHALLAEIDRALSVLKASGAFDAILDRWSGTGATLVPDWVVRAAVAGGTTAALALAGLGWQAMRLRARTARLLREVQERQRAEAALAASQERLALASAAAGLGVFDVDMRSRTGIVNSEFRALYGLPPGEGPLPQAEWLACIHPEDRARLAAIADETFHTGGGYSAEYRILRPDSGAERWISARGSVVAARDGVPARLVGISQDITERRLEEERQMLLAREVDHRARNVLAVVQSVVRLTRSEDPKDFAAAVEGRVAALARAHSLLSRDRWTGAELEEVVREEFAAYRDVAAPALSGPSLRLDPAAVQPLSMVVHELVTNAAKYGALSLPGGRVRMGWRLVPEEDGERLVIEWAERGGPAVAGPPARRGFGSALIGATVRSQLGGRIGMDWAADGLRCTIDLPTQGILAAQQGEPQGAALYGRRVLLVEDEPLVALLLQQVLQDAGCTVRGPASTLADAERLAGEDGLDAAVLDVNLPGGPSLPLGARLAARGVPVVYVTGLEGVPGREGAVVLRKPVRAEVLLAALGRAMRPAG
jgi:PAS domain S-box-containing protein